MTEKSEIEMQEGERQALAFLDTADAERFRGYLESLTLKAGEVLIREGEPILRAAFLIKGRLAVKKETDFSGKYILLALLENGAIVGEGSMAGRECHGATVEALEECSLLVLPREAFERLTLDLPHLAVQLLKRMLCVSGVRLEQIGERLARLL